MQKFRWGTSELQHPILTTVSRTFNNQVLSFSASAKKFGAFKSFSGVSEKLSVYFSRRKICGDGHSMLEMMDSRNFMTIVVFCWRQTPGPGSVQFSCRKNGSFNDLDPQCATGGWGDGICSWILCDFQQDCSQFSWTGIRMETWNTPRSTLCATARRSSWHQQQKKLWMNIFRADIWFGGFLSLLRGRADHTAPASKAYS